MATALSVREVVLFDLDQTVVPWDTQLVFRSYVLQKEPWRRALGLVFPLFLPFAKLLGAGGLKQVFHCYLWGMRTSQLQAYAAAFAQEWVPHLFYPQIVAEIEEHRKADRLTVLASASPELWVREIGASLGFDLSEGTRVDWGERVDFFPQLIGENHKGEEKVRRLREHGITAGKIGYSDSAADLPMLHLCEEKVLVHPLPGVRAIGEKHGWRLVFPSKPWKSRLAFALAGAKQYFGFWKP